MEKTPKMDKNRPSWVQGGVGITATLHSSLHHSPRSTQKMAADLFDANEQAHTRVNPLTGETVLCSPHRTKRPWQGQQEASVEDKQDPFDPKCYLCPENVRANGQKNDKYSSTFVFENDFAAVKFDQDDEPIFTSSSPLSSSTTSPFFQKSPARGKCYVICFSPRHDLTIPQLTIDNIVDIIKAWKKIYCDVSKEYPWIKYIQIFENKGAVMGCSNPHPHGQVWCLDHIPSTAAKIFQSQYDFSIGRHAMSSSFENLSTNAPRLNNGSPGLLLEYAHAEISLHNSSTGAGSSRIVVQGTDFVSIVPHWATWPFEIIIIPYTSHIPSLAYFSLEQMSDLASVLSRTTIRLDNLFRCSFPYSLGIYQLPVNTNPSFPGNENFSANQFFISLYPPLLRSANVKKFLVGFELFAEAQRDLTPEQAAARLRECSETHYSLTE